MQVAASLSLVPNAVRSRSSAPTIAPAIDGVLSLIAGSTSLSPSEKKSFIQDLANITKFGGNDPKLIMKLLKAIMALIASRPAGTYPADNLKDVEAQYQADMGNTGAATSTSTAATDLYA